MNLSARNAAMVVFGGFITYSAFATQSNTPNPNSNAKSNGSYRVAPALEKEPLESPSWFNLQNILIPLQAGVFFSSQGSSSHFVGIQGLIGDTFNNNNTNGNNGLFGLGYYINGWNAPLFSLYYGVNAYYLGQVNINGTIVQEDLFTNLAYSYSINNYPIYLAAKALINNNTSDRYNITLDFGLGPNIINTSNFLETSLDGGITIPDNAYRGQTNTVFSVTAGIGVKFNNIVREFPIECGYRFYYLGQGTLAPVTNQILNNLDTGANYANAVICSVIV